MKCQLEGRPISIVEPYIWALQNYQELVPLEHSTRKSFGLILNLIKLSWHSGQEAGPGGGKLGWRLKKWRVQLLQQTIRSRVSCCALWGRGTQHQLQNGGECWMLPKVLKKGELKRLVELWRCLVADGKWNVTRTKRWQQYQKENTREEGEERVRKGGQGFGSV